VSVAKARLKATVMDAEAVRRCLSRIAHEIVEHNHGVEEIALVGILNKGDHLAHRLAAKLRELEGADVPVGALDVSRHRDDLHLRQPAEHRPSEMPKVDGLTVVLVDDVIHHGRTVRAALDALLEYGRPRAIQLAVLVDRGHRELPLRADYVGKNVPTSRTESVHVLLTEHDGRDGVVITK
jgi:pyrimidine operon attenuation protein/uracil phosphoribosyltransferase